MKCKQTLLIALAISVLTFTTHARAEMREVFGFTSSAIPPVLELDGGAMRINASAQGWFDDLGKRGPGGNYVVGLCGSGYFCEEPGRDHHDFMRFDTGQLGSRVSSASLLLWNPQALDGGGDGYFSSHSSETFLLHDVTSSPADLMQPGTRRPDIYADSGSGTFYGQAIVSAADNGTWVRVPLNAAALDAINGAAGRSIAFGGSLAGVNAVPEPGTIGLALGGLTLLAWRMKRRRVR